MKCRTSTHLEKITRDHCPTVQYRFSMAHVNQFLHCLKFRRGFTPWHAVGIVHFFYSVIGCWLWCRHIISIPLLGNFLAQFWNWSKLTSFTSFQLSYLVATHFRPYFLRPNDLPCRHLLTADRKLPACLEVSPCVFPAVESVLITICCSHIKSEDLSIL